MNRFGSIRFGSVIFEASSFRFGSVWQLFFPVRCGSACAFCMRHGSVRFGSVPRSVPRSFPRSVPRSVLRSVPAGSGINRFGSVRFASAGSVRCRVPSRTGRADALIVLDKGFSHGRTRRGTDSILYSDILHYTLVYYIMLYYLVLPYSIAN